MRKKLLFAISMVLALVMSVTCVVYLVPGEGTQKTEQVTASQELEVVKANIDIPESQTLSRIKADYLKKNGGYKDGDEVVAIITLSADALIETYNKGLTAKASVADYALSAAGKRQAKFLLAEQNALIDELTEKKLIDKVNYNYSTVLNAVAVTTTYGNFKKLEKLSSVQDVVLADTYSRPLAEGNTDASAIVNAVDVYETGIFNSSSVKYKGKGTAVAILDSGFDCSHSVFANQPADNELWINKDKVESVLPTTRAAGFTKGLSLPDVWYSNKIPFTYDYADKDNDVFPYDSEHGTHVAGIIGGNDDVITGVAVETQLVLLKVFPDLDEGARTDDILAALDDAVLLNVDAINMSLGSSCGFTREEDGNVINAVYDRIDESGISLITAASNSYSSAFGGAQGNTNKVWNPDSGTVGSPSTYAAALSVASISGTKSKYLIGNDSQVIFFTESNSITGDPNDFFAEIYAKLKTEGKNVEYGDEVTVEYITVPGVGTTTNFRTVASQIKGKVALVRRGDNTFEEKARNAKNAGALACIIYNNVEGDINMSMGKSDHIPTVSISKEMGTALAARSSGTLTLKGSNQAGPFMSDFSSWGPTPGLEIKPEITAHGGNIKSAVPGGEYDELSGTSMASPNLCGIVVLIRQFIKENYPEIKDKPKEISVFANRLLMSTASIVLNEEGVPYSPRKQGAGLASLFNVVNTKAYLTVDGKDRSKLELFDDPDRTGVYTMQFNLVNLGDTPLEYDLSLLGMTETVSSSDADFVAETGHILDGKYSVTVTGDGSYASGKVTVSAGKNKSVGIKLTYTLTDGDKNYIDTRFPYGMYVEGFVKLEAAGEEIDLNIPFLAYYGDWMQAPMFDKTYYEVESEAHNGGIDEEDKLKADYYATTPYGSYFYSYIIPLGTYLYDVPAGYDEIPASEEHIAMSNAYATVDGISAVYSGLLRGAKEMKYTITDKLSGETLWDYVDYNANKSYSLGGAPLPSYEYLNLRTTSDKLNGKLLNNREYEFKMQGTLDYGEDGGLYTNARNTFDFDFTFDNEAPVVKSATYEKTYDRTLKKDRYYVTLTVYDNHYVMSVSPIAFINNSATNSLTYTYLTDNPIPVYSSKGADNKIRIEITDMLDDMYHDQLITSSIMFMVDDYALNSDVFMCALPGTSGDFKFTTDGSYEGRDLRTLELGVNQIIDLTDYLATSDATVDADKDYLSHLDWESSNTGVAVVEHGQVRGIAPGATTITATELLGLKSARLLVRVTQSSVKNAALEATVEPLEEGRVVESQLRTKNDVDNASDGTIESIKISYFDTEYAHARAGQQSEIGTTGSRVYASALPATGTPAWPTVSIYPGERIRLHYDVKPWYVEEKYDITFTSNNPDIAAVSTEGLVTALKEGSATITVSVKGSNLLTSININVKNPFVIEDRMLVAYKGLGGDVVIPDDEGISYIASYAFCLYTTDNTIYVDEDDYDANKIPQANTTVTSVTVPYGVEDVQKYAFYNCTGLESVTLPSTIRFVRQYAFAGDDKLKTINLEDVEVIGASAFEGCVSLENVNLTKAYAIGMRAFRNCTSLTKIDLSALRNTGVQAFTGCEKLEKVTLTANTKLSLGMFARSGLKTVDVYETVEIPQYCFSQCVNLTTVNIHNDLVTIGLGAFCENPKLTTVNFYGSVETLGSQVFYDCENLTKITLPNSKITVGSNAFLDCDKLEEVVFGKDTVLTSVGALFAGTKISKFTVAEGSIYSASEDGKLLLTDDGKTAVLAAVGAQFGEYELPEAITKIASSAFAGTDISVLIINDSVDIGDYAFTSCDKLTRVVFPELSTATVTIGSNAFRANEELITLENFEMVKKVGSYAFADTGLETVTIGSDAEFGEGAFFQTQLRSVSIGANTKFGLGAFQSCTHLMTVNMPEEGGVHFGPACFMYDTLLKTIDLSKHDAVIEAQAFYGCTSLTTANLAEVTEIDTYAFGECSSLTSATVPKLIRLGEGAFARNDDYGTGAAFIKIQLPNTLKEIGDGAFLGCSRLQSIEIPSSVEKFGDFMFGFCSSLERVTLPESVTEIGAYSFISCESLTSVTAPGVTKVGDGAFMGCASLTSFDFGKVVYVGDGAFTSSGLYGTINAPELEYIGLHGFESVYNIIGFNAPKLAVIEEAAFMDCFNLATFTFSEKLEKIGLMAFYCDTTLGMPRLLNFYMMDGEERVTSGKLNDFALLDDGMLYTVLSSGKLQLVAVPSAKMSETLTVKEGTVRIEAYAGNSNTNVKNIVLPDSLKVIGNFAFYGYTKLESVEFKSFAAPALENWYISDTNPNGYPASLNEGDPGYELLQGNFDLFEYELLYFNFINLVGKRVPIKMILPANTNVTGYDSLIYEAYFGKVADAKRSSYEAMDTNFHNFVDYAREVMAIETITLADSKLVDKALTAYNAVRQDYTKYGYTEKEWTEMANAVLAARARIVRIGIENANYAVRTLQAKIDDLPAAFSESVRAAMDEITADMAKLTVDERGILDLTKYNALLSDYGKDPGVDLGPDYAVRTLQAKIDNLPAVFTESVRAAMDEITEGIAKLTVDERGMLDLTKYKALLSDYGKDPNSGDDGCHCGLEGMAGTFAAVVATLMLALCAVAVRARKKKA